MNRLNELIQTIERWRHVKRYDVTKTVSRLKILDAIIATI